MLHATNNTFANIPYYGYLPMMQTNFGGDIQLCTMDPEYNYNLGYNLNPVAQQMMGGSIFTNVGQAATCYAANPFAGGGISSTPSTSGIPTPGTQAFNDAVRQGASQIVGKILNTMTSANLNRCLANVQQAKTALEAQLTNTNITDDQKKQVNDMLDKVKAQEDELKKIAESSDLDPKTAYDKVGEQEKALRQILVDTSKVIKDINTSTSTEESTTTSTGETSTDETSTGASSTTGTSTTETTGTSAVHSATAPQGASTDESTTTDESSPIAEVKNPANDTGVFSWVQKFYDATYGGWSTDDDTFNAVCEVIDKDTVMPLMVSWNANKSKEKGESFMDAFLWDADRSQKIKYGKQIAGALREKAMELGIAQDPELQKAFTKVDHEMHSRLWVDNDKASEGFNKAIEIIAKKMGGEYAKYAKPQKESK